MDILKAVLFAFLPIAGLTHVIAYYSYRNGLVSIHEDKTDEWDIAGKKRSNPQQKDKGNQGGLDDRIDVAIDDALEGSEKATNNYLHKKWVSFGGGFYGLMALVTFFVIEVREVFGFILRIEGWHTLTDLLNLDALIDIFVDSILNMVDAFVWFNYWPDIIAIGNGWVWLGMAYGGYHLGRWVAELRLEKAGL